ncbi:MAG: hypothetical protein FJW39_27935 [Acidobacteria bacterium]|nr:hypothetical protein [Acidobacteriota bacterium]
MLIRVAALGLAVLVAAPAQTDYKTDLPHPRLLLPQRRARLVKRERERESMRWIAFQTLAMGKITWPEPGFALSLYHVATENPEPGRQAIQWALGPGSDLRQLAIVFDWCHSLLSPEERKRLAAKIQQLLEKPGAAGIASMRARVMAAVAVSGEIPDAGARHIRPVVDEWWKKQIAPKILAGGNPVDLKDHMPLFELFHVLRDNFDIDLREDAAKYFTTIPAFHILAHYPAPYPAAENEYRIPLMKLHGEPDTRESVRSRTAGLMMVAYDNNAQEVQFVQGWLMQDRFLMKSSYGIPYEYLWANPYQPGLSFHYLPNVFHDPSSGRLLIRSTWEDDAVWFYQAEGVMQMFKDGQIVNLGALKEAVVMGNTTLLPAALASQFQVGGADVASRYYVIGLEAAKRYDLEVEDEGIREVLTDRGGVAEIVFPPKRTAVVRMKRSPVE